MQFAVERRGSLVLSEGGKHGGALAIEALLVDLGVGEVEQAHRAQGELVPFAVGKRSYTLAGRADEPPDAFHRHGARWIAGNEV